MIQTRTIVFRAVVLLCIIASSVFSAQAFYMATPYSVVGNKMMVRAKIGSEVGNFVLDTGAPCTLTDAFAKRAGINGGQTIQFSDSNGMPVTLRVADLRSLILGGVNFMELQAMVLEPGNFMEQMGADGIIGYNLMRQGIVKFDSRQKLFILTDERDSLALNYNYCSELLQNSFVPLIPIRIGAQVDTVMFDSGAESFYEISTRSFARIKSDTASLKVLNHGFGSLSAGAAGIEELSEKWRTLAPVVHIGAAPFRNATSITTDAVDSRIGFPLLDYGDVVIDYADGFFYFMPHDTSLIPNVYEPEWNVVPIAVDNGLVAGIVWDAQSDGIQSGDPIVAINGERIGRVNLQEALTRQLFNLNPQGTPITYLNRRNNQEEQTVMRRQ